ncbi:hypothetical protein AVEN_226793-1, partial [Araneus ventricosus]
MPKPQTRTPAKERKNRQSKR